MTEWAVPQNSIIAIISGSCPAGWSSYSTINSNFIISDSTVDTTPAGSNTHVSHTANHTHTYSETVAGYHTGTFGVTHGYATQHSHTISWTSTNPVAITVGSGTHTPAYATLIFCKKG